jgi:hypothetical protein
MTPARQEIAGGWLQVQGLDLPLMKAETALLLDLTGL